MLKKSFLVVAIAMALLSGCGGDDQDLVGGLTATGEGIGDAADAFEIVYQWSQQFAPTE